MSNSVPVAFIRDYNADMHHGYQRDGAYLRNTVRTKNGVIGYSHTFQKLGAGEATEKGRHATVPLMNLAHTNVTCTLVDKFAAEMIDDFDQLKTLTQEKAEYQKSALMALGRAQDQQIIDALTNSGVSSSLTFDLATTEKKLKAQLLAFLKLLWAADVPPGDGMTFVVVPTTLWAALGTIAEFTSMDYSINPGTVAVPIQGETFPMRGTWRRGLNAWWGVHTGVGGAGTGTADVWAYHKTAVGSAVGSEIRTDISFENPEDSWLVKSKFSSGACAIDTNGIKRGAVDDQAATLPPTA